MTAAGQPRKKIALFGKSLTLASVGASLGQYQPLEVVTLDPENAAAEQELQALAPDVILLDLAAGQVDRVISLLGERPRTQLIGLDAAGERFLLLSGQPASTLSTQDLVELIVTATWKLDQPTTHGGTS